MLNAIKIYGKTKKGLRIGFFNAVTEKTNATIKNNNKGEVRKEVIDPFTNYNILVLDQQFNQNSIISLINTNVTRDSRFRNANVAALDGHLETKNNKYNIDGSVKMSNISDVVNTPSIGYTLDNSIGYGAGNWRWEAGNSFENKDFNPNYFGILFSNNQQSIYANGGWRTLQPTKNFNSYNFNFYNQLNYHHYSRVYKGYEVGLN
jgi:hypothetical protein